MLRKIYQILEISHASCQSTPATDIYEYLFCSLPPFGCVRYIESYTDLYISVIKLLYKRTSAQHTFLSSYIGRLLVSLIQNQYISLTIAAKNNHICIYKIILKFDVCIHHCTQANFCRIQGNFTRRDPFGQIILQ